MKALLRLPNRVAYVLPRVFLLGLFLVYVSFMLFSSYDWFGTAANDFRTAALRFFSYLAGFFG